MASTVKALRWYFAIGGVAVVVLFVIASMEMLVSRIKEMHPVILIMWFYIVYGIIAYTLLISFAPFRWLARHIQP